MGSMQSDVALKAVEDLKHDLYGNGQPGDIQRIDGRLDRQGESIRQLQEFRWKAVGAFGAITGVISFLSGDGILSLKHFLGK